jgi:hypothetical protein
MTIMRILSSKTFLRVPSVCNNAEDAGAGPEAVVTVVGADTTFARPVVLVVGSTGVVVLPLSGAGVAAVVLVVSVFTAFAIPV